MRALSLKESSIGKSKTIAAAVVSVQGRATKNKWAHLALSGEESNDEKCETIATTEASVQGRATK